MKERKRFDEYEEEESGNYLDNPLDLMTQAIKVHSKDGELNEDATLCDLSQTLPAMGKYISEQIVCINLVHSYLYVGRNIVKKTNKLEKGGNGFKEEEIDNPNKKYFEDIKRIMMNRSNSLLILSRSVKGSPLKAFLTYGRETTKKELGMEEKRGFVDKLFGRKKEEETI